MTPKAAEKRELILEHANNVFIKKGFSKVTMKDIIEESNISRGGIYLYFSSIDEIFVEVVKRRNQFKIQEIKNTIEKNNNFQEILDDFFNEQKERLLNMDKSLFRAMMEYCCSHKQESEKDFYLEHYLNTKNMVLELLKFGQEQNEISAKNIDCLADTIMYLIEGLRTLAVSSGISEKLVEEQLSVCRNMIYSALF